MTLATTATDPPTRPPAGTAAALLAAGLHLFGRDGFEATSTRALAARAGTNVASIAYHFGSKDGLRQACAAEVARRIGGVIGPLSDPGSLPPDAARDRLAGMVQALAGFVAGADAAADTVAFVVREMADDGPVIDLLYDRVIAPRHADLSALWAAATGQPADTEDTAIAAFALIGQVLYFRVAQPVVLRRMGWARIGPAEAARIAAVLTAQLDTLIQAARQP